MDRQSGGPRAELNRSKSSTVNSSFSTNNASAHRNLQNGADSQPQLHGASNAPVGGGAAKQVEPSAPQRGTRAVPKAPTSQSASVSLNSTAHATHAKAPGDPSKAFHFQFGSIGMQIPARTSSAPPNLDEQKRDQARHDTYRTVPNIPIPSVPKEQLPRKDAGAPDQSSTGEVHQVPKVKKDPQVSFPPTASQTQKPSVLPVPMPSMQIPFHQPQVSVQFGGHQSQNVTATSLSMPMPIPLPMGNAPQVQQHMLFPGLHPHPLQPQGHMHPGQGMGFTTQMGPPQMPPQLGNMGMGITPQYPQQQGGKFGGCPRKTVVKITHPDTHKEVGFDERVDTYSDGGVAGPRSQSKSSTAKEIRLDERVKLIRSTSSTARGKKKKKEILQKAESARTTSDLYMAYKGPEEKKETVPSKSAESTLTVGNSKQPPSDTLHVDAVAIDKIVQSNVEPDDWEDAADISTPNLEPLDGREHVPGVRHDENGKGNVVKKYSRDFLLKFAIQCTDLPEGFEIEGRICFKLKLKKKEKKILKKMKKKFLSE